MVPVESESMNWILVQRILGYIGIPLVPFLGGAILWPLAFSRQPYWFWFARSAFCLGAGWVALFTFAFFYGIRSFGGVGYEPGVYILVLLLMLESCVIGLLAFSSKWRALAAIPVLPAMVLGVSWLWSLL